MTLTQLSTLLQTITGGITDAVYLRATDNDANVSIDNIDLNGKTIVLFNNLPEVTYNVTRSGYMLQQFPVEIRVLRLAAIDDTTVDSDAIRDACSAVCDNIFDKITKHQTMPDAFEYSVTFLGEVNIYDKVMTGARLSFVFHSDRTKFNC